MARPQKTPAAQGSESRETREAESRENLPNPVWFKPIMFGFMLVGRAWIIVWTDSGRGRMRSKRARVSRGR